jgi:hypothetical protein
MMKLTRKNALFGSLALAICLAQGAMAEDSATIVADCQFATPSQFTLSKLSVRVEKVGNEYAGVLVQYARIVGDPQLQYIPVSAVKVERSGNEQSSVQFRDSGDFELSINLNDKSSDGTFTGTFTDKEKPGTESNLPQTPQPVTCTIAGV